jgi:cell division protein FtsB
MRSNRNRYSDIKKINNYNTKLESKNKRYEVHEAIVATLEDVALRLVQRWGKGKLERLASPQLAVAFQQAKQNYENATLENDVNYIAQKARNLIQGWQALEKYAKQQGHKPEPSKIWYAIAPIELNAFTYAIVRESSDRQFVDKESADRIYTIDEVAWILHSFEKNNKAATEVKDLFSGSEIVSVGTGEYDKYGKEIIKGAKKNEKQEDRYADLDDEIPF